MQVIPFYVGSVAEAVQKIRAQLGPEAVVLSVRKVDPSGLARFWQKPRLEVLARRGEEKTETTATHVSVQRSDTEAQEPAVREKRNNFVTAKISQTYVRPSQDTPVPGEMWQIEKLLGNSGLLPTQAKRVVDLVQAQHGEKPLPTLAEELALTRSVLSRMWRKPPSFRKGATQLHAFVGPFGSGKTTCLCKWLTQAVLVEGCAPRVWRLDGATANNAETLSVLCEILGAPVERSWKRNERLADGQIGFIDLPGVDWQSASAVRALGEHLKQLPYVHVHLVLNAAYEVPVLLAQARAFAGLPIADLALTHLDEEQRWGKLWNFALGTNYTIRFLSAGQNIPGEFSEATPEKLFRHFIPAN